MRYVASSTVLGLLFGPAHLQLGLYLSALGNHLVGDGPCRRRLVGRQVERVLGAVDGEVGVEHLRELVSDSGWVHPRRRQGRQPRCERLAIGMTGYGHRGAGGCVMHSSKIFRQRPLGRVRDRARHMDQG